MRKTLWLFMGPPGCGKGTQAVQLKNQGIVEHFSTGDLLRSAIKSQSPLGLEVQSRVDSGQLVPDYIMLDILMEAMSSERFVHDLVLDGYPRTFSQVESLVAMISSRSEDFSLGGVFWFDIDLAILVRRAVSRRSCIQCGAIYNIEFKPTKVPNLCDACGGSLLHRKDDNEETISKRIALYNLETKPLLEVIKTYSQVIVLDADRPEQEIFQEIVNYLKKK
jgi:adenylate kinase